MAPGLFNSVAALTVETALARLLELDPASQAQALALSGRSLCLTLEPGPVHLALVFTDQGVYVHGCGPEEAGADACVALDPVALAALLEGGAGQVHNVPGLTISGDSQVAAEVMALLRNLRPDLLAPLRGLLGPEAGFLADSTLARGRQRLRQGREKLSARAREALTGADGPLPSRAEVDALLDEIDDLRLAADRLEARITQLVRARDADE